MVDPGDLGIARLGECRYDSPLGRFIAGRQTNEHYVDEDDRVLLDDTVSLLRARNLPVDRLPSFEPGGPRRRLFFASGTTTVGIVTCGGLCPGLNDVIRGLVAELSNHYGCNGFWGSGTALPVWCRVACRRSGSIRTRWRPSTNRAAPSWEPHAGRRIRI